VAKPGISQLAQGDLRKYAVLGAEARLLQLAEEAAAIYRAFPELRDREVTQPSKATSNGRQTRRRRRTMTAAERKAVSARMRKYWAGRRAAKTVASNAARQTLSTDGVQSQARKKR